ncbi:MAG: aminoglycoside 6-adenylyltransferase [Anaerolineae bacterium]|nr:aminoglycoside 6-adenylyltransferase [Anaerolineae bacterium]
MDHFIPHITHWADERDDIRAVLLVGSYARRDHPADIYSDLDLIVYTTNWGDYLRDPTWVEQFGPVWVKIIDWIGEPPEPEFLVLYAGGVKLDFALFTVDKLRRRVDTGELGDTLARGYRVLVDKDGLAARLPDPPAQIPIPEPPTSDQFAAVVDAFWYHAANTARQIARGNLWNVKTRDWALKQTLLTMLEWHARAVYGRDTWHDGKFLPEWTDPESHDELLEGCFGHFDAADSWRALRATMALFRRLAADLAARLGYAYPAALDADVTRYIHELDSRQTRRAGRE